MLPEQTPELTLANSEPFRQRVDIRFVEATRLDQPERAGYGVGTATPEGELRRRLRPAAETRAKSRCLRRRRGGKEADVFSLGRGRRAKRSTINARSS